MGFNQTTLVVTTFQKYDASGAAMTRHWEQALMIMASNNGDSAGNIYVQLYNC